MGTSTRHTTLHYVTRSCTLLLFIIILHLIGDTFYFYFREKIRNELFRETVFPRDYFYRFDVRNCTIINSIIEILTV